MSEAKPLGVQAIVRTGLSLSELNLIASHHFQEQTVRAKVKISTMIYQLPPLRQSASLLAFPTRFVSLSLKSPSSTRPSRLLANNSAP